MRCASWRARSSTDHCTHERLKAVESAPEWFDRSVWAALARADLLGVALPEDVGGSGLGFVELCLLLEEVGRAVVPDPGMGDAGAGRACRSTGSAPPLSAGASFPA